MPLAIGQCGGPMGQLPGIESTARRQSGALGSKSCGIVAERDGRRNMIKASLIFASGLATGFGLMYVLDPDRGSRRRALLRHQALRATHEALDLIGKASDWAQENRPPRLPLLAGAAGISLALMALGGRRLVSRRRSLSSPGLAESVAPVPASW